MSSCTCELFPLAERPECADRCIALLNEEWPRSITQREASMAKTLNMEPPMAFGLRLGSGEIVGHAKLCPLPDKSTGCWVEAVVVKREFRGKGIGRILMTMLEAEAKTRGYKEVYLSTHDKQAFYAKLGYKTTSPVLNYGANSRLFQSRFPTGFTDTSNTDSTPGGTRSACITARQIIRAEIEMNAADASCPPAPPPPAERAVLQGTPQKVYMRKELC